MNLLDQISDSESQQSLSLVERITQAQGKWVSRDDVGLVTERSALLLALNPPFASRWEAVLMRGEVVDDERFNRGNLRVEFHCRDVVDPINSVIERVRTKRVLMDACRQARAIHYLEDSQVGAGISTDIRRWVIELEDIGCLCISLIQDSEATFDDLPDLVSEM